MIPRFAPSARARTHFSGSFNRASTTTLSNAGNAPITNNACHGWSANGSACFAASAPTPMPIRPAVMFPHADSDCNNPSAGARARSGTESATKATARPNTPPTPSPVTKR